MIGNSFPPADRPLLIRNARPVGFAGIDADAFDILIGKDGKITQSGVAIAAPENAEILEAGGSFLSPGWTDIHTHVWYGGTDISLKPEQCGARHGVTTMVDTGTAGAKHFLHFKRTVIDLAQTRILAYINIVDLGMVGDFEQDINTMDPELAASIALAYPDICVGIKTAHYWTKEPFDELHPPWTAVERAVEAGDLCKKPVMVDFWPRPERPFFVEQFSKEIPRYPDRHRMRAGITGWAQVNGLRGETSLADRVEWDNHYIENWSLWLDAKIVLRSLQAVLGHRNAG
jgi:dihydroorotase